MRFLFFVFAVAAITLYYFLHVVKMCTAFVYPIDNAYIHLAMAKNFAFEGIWSPQTMYSIMSSSSSPGFVLILSLFFKIFGNHELIPIYLNIFILLFLVFFVHKCFLNSYNTIIYIIFSFFFLSLFLPHNQIITGMEHLFHCLFMLLSFKKLHDLLLNNFMRNDIILFCFFTALATLFRFETLFYICDKSIKLASVNINHQQICMSKFIGKYYNNSNIIINFVGAISYYTKAKYIDLYGLASPHILNYKFKTNDKKFKNLPYLIEKEAKETKERLICIYENSFKKIPASWQIENIVACGKGTVYFFGINKQQYSDIILNFKAFQNKLNPTIKVKYF